MNASSSLPIVANPALLAGEPWGTGSITVNLPEGPYAVTDLAQQQLEAMASR